MSTFDSLPTELLQLIFGHCRRPYDQANIRAVCRRWAEAVEPLQLRRACLKVSYNTYVPGSGRFKLIDDAVLSGSDRPYNCFRIEWGSRDSIDSKEALKEALDVCQERFPVRRLYLTAPPQRRLAQFFRDRHQWLQTLVELHVTLGWSNPKGCELSLPSLKQLTWYEPRLLFPDRPFVLNAPELSQLNVVLFEGLKQLEPVNRPLMSGLELKSCPKLGNATLVGHHDLNQRHVEACEPFLRNLKVLSLYDCDDGISSIICDKCTSLKELIAIADLPLTVRSLQISTALSANLETLKLDKFNLYDQATFPMLQHLCLRGVKILNSASLVAPQLTTFISTDTNIDQLKVIHKNRICTLKIDREMVPPPPNVTELYLSLFTSHESWFPPNYLQHFPNVVRLTMVENAQPRPMDCAFLDYMPKLESFSALGFKIRLTDLNNFAGLKSLILTHCTIKCEPNDDAPQQVQLTALEYFRVQYVTVLDCNNSASGEIMFPVKVNERQPPIHLLGTSSYWGKDVFTSGTFESNMADEIKVCSDYRLRARPIGSMRRYRF